MERLSGKVVLITGGTSGIGRACAELMAREGAQVIAMSIQQAEGHDLQQQLTGEGRECVFFHGDTSCEADVQSAVRLALDRYGRLDVAHANAGLLRNQRITELTLEDFHALINVNLLGPALVAKHAIPVMERQGRGVICFTTSVAADIGFPGHAIYCAVQGRIGRDDALPGHRSQSPGPEVCRRQPRYDRYADARQVLRRMGQAQGSAVCGSGAQDPRAAIRDTRRRCAAPSPSWSAMKRGSSTAASCTWRVAPWLCLRGETPSGRRRAR